ncbi:MAG: hypothetical protein SFZ03_12340 [Candidatus Melainabacteria bacterium]|nr:hypothetical protein [Candidatus Melainabacteria bacterium]
MGEAEQRQQNQQNWQQLLGQADQLMGLINQRLGTGDPNTVGTVPGGNNTPAINSLTSEANRQFGELSVLFSIMPDYVTHFGDLHEDFNALHTAFTGAPAPNLMDQPGAGNFGNLPLGQTLNGMDAQMAQMLGAMPVGLQSNLAGDMGQAMAGMPQGQWAVNPFINPALGGNIGGNVGGNIGGSTSMMPTHQFAMTMNFTGDPAFDQQLVSFDTSMSGVLNGLPGSLQQSLMPVLNSVMPPGSMQIIPPTTAMNPGGMMPMGNGPMVGAMGGNMSGNMGTMLPYATNTGLSPFMFNTPGMPSTMMNPAMAMNPVMQQTMALVYPNHPALAGAYNPLAGNGAFQLAGGIPGGIQSPGWNNALQPVNPMAFSGVGNGNLLPQMAGGGTLIGLIPVIQTNNAAISYGMPMAV